MIKHVLLLDDDQVQNQILKEGFLKKHLVSNLAKFDVLDSPENIIPIIQSIKLDLVILDYFLSGATSTSIASSIKYRQPDCKIWLYSGYNPEFLHKTDKSLFDKCIEKKINEGLTHLLDEIYDHITKVHVDIKEPLSGFSLL